MTEQEQSKDFFISYTSADKPWAEWLAWRLEEAGFTTIIQAWDFHAGGNFVLDMDKAAKLATHTIAVLSPDYFASQFAPSEWAAAFRRDPRGEHGTLIPVRVRSCDVEGILGQIVYIDLVDQDEAIAKQTFLGHISRERRKPAHEPAFPSQPVPIFPGVFPSIWNIPYPRNPFFMGRDDLLSRLHAVLQAGQVTALSQPQAISGLGGIGKTHIAIEYAYRYRQEYEVVLWAGASNQEALVSSYSAIATLLKLPEREASEQEITIGAAKKWLQTHRKWLLILDNADDLDLLPVYLPPVLGGHILITTRAWAMRRLAQRIEVETLPDEQGALFLLQRAALVAPDVSLDHVSIEDRELSVQIAQELGGLPLAIDQAGAYLEETSMSLSLYRQIYQQHRQSLLQERRAHVPDHPEPVATTWSLSFKRVEEQNAAAADLLRLCAYLAPDAIPERILTEGASHLGPLLAPVAADPFRFGQAIEVLRAYSLIQRDPRTQTLSVHRLVQAVLRDSMGCDAVKEWKQRAVRAVDASSPDVQDVTQWNACEQWLPHARACATWIEQESMTLPEAASMLNKAGYYLQTRARYAEAEPLYRRALEINEEQLGVTDPDTAESLNNLAQLYYTQGKYAEAEPMLVRALEIYEEQLGANHPDTASSQNNLAVLYYTQGKYAEAEPMLVRALEIKEAQLGARHPGTANSQNNLAQLYYTQGKYGKAEPLLKRALEIYEEQLGANHPDTAQILNNLAQLYYTQGKYAEAEPLYRRALEIYEDEEQLGARHPNTAQILNNLAELCRAQGKDAEAEPMLVRALEIYEEQLGADHPNTAQILNNLASLYNDQGKYGKAEPLLKRALEINEKQLGATHSTTATSLNNLAGLYDTQGKYAEAGPLYRRALEINEEQLGADHPNTAQILNNLAGLYDTQGKYAEAGPLYRRALEINERVLGATHPTTAESLNNLAELYRAQGKDAEAGPLLKRALEINERVLGADHPDTVIVRANYTDLLSELEADGTQS